MMNNWKLLVTRETALLERYLRIYAYNQMFSNLSFLKVNNLLAINKYGLTSIYFDEDERKEQLKIILSEYKNHKFHGFFPYWEDIIEKVKLTAKNFIENPEKEQLGQFIDSYGLGRAIVFYTELLSRALQEQMDTADLEAVGQWHERAEKETCMAWDAIELVFQQIGEKERIPVERLLYYTPLEFFDFLEMNKKVEDSILNERKRYYVLLLKNGEISLHLDKEAQKIENQVAASEYIEPITEIRGTVACKGKTKGSVRIVNTRNQMKEMRKGEILVSIMTTPRLIHATHKASAIITDEGGITSHAAIVSRELDIPCIVGTKVATSVFKDGDLVEVDADKGIVRKIND